MTITAATKGPVAGLRNDSEPRSAASDLRSATDDEILNLSPRAVKKSVRREEQRAAEDETGEASQSREGEDSAIRKRSESGRDAKGPNPSEFSEVEKAALDASPELKAAWEDASAFRESFASPEEARNASRLLNEVNELDSLFFSRRAEDHAQLARTIADLDPAAAASLGRALTQMAVGSQRGSVTRPSVEQAEDASGRPVEVESKQPGVEGLAPKVERQIPAAEAQSEFLQATNAAAVESVIDAIQSQVDRVFPDGSSQAARNRVVGEVYRELDLSLRANRQLNEQLRQALRTGTLDAAHQRAIVSLIVHRARQVLPGVTKRVMTEWTAALISAGDERRARQRAAEARVDIAGSGRTGSDGRRALSPRELDYSRLSDADILNL